jgi:nascent polypeptide-associated complex subunit beta
LDRCSVGTQRRKKKHVTVQNVNEDKKLKSAIKKFGVQPLQDIEEVNMFKDDNTVVHFKRPLSKFL